MFKKGLEDFLESTFPSVHEVIDRIRPDCNHCGEKAVPIKCASCGEYSCHKCAFINALSGRLLCGLCAREVILGDEEESGEWETVDNPEPPPKPKKRAYDPWKVLGIKADASRGDVVKAYRKLALQYHPDHNDGDDSTFREVQKARDAIIKFLDSEEKP